MSASAQSGPDPLDLPIRVTPGDIPVEAVYGHPRRYQVRFPGVDAFFAAQAAEAPATFRTAVAIPRRATLAVEVPSLVAGRVTALQNETTTLDYFAREYGAAIMEDYQYAMDATSVFAAESFLGEDQAQATLDDVVKRIRADECWDESSGEDIVIAVVDTGIDGRHPEFPEERRAGGWAPGGDSPWVDWKGHGTMCAAIAAGTREAGGRYNGVAPGARLAACRTRFFDTELAGAYQYLIDRVEEDGWRVVATNSYGVPTGAAPPPPDTVFMEALADAIDAGITVVFSAGNYHELTGGDALACEPTSIWQYKCRADLLTVGTCRLDGSMWPYSSRGPGQLFGQSGAGEKPDVLAPTPAHGAILYGGSVRVLANGWGTSGAAPQAAGLAALLLSRNPGLTSAEVFDSIRDAAVPVTGRRACEGRGLIDCRAALDRVGRAP